MNACPQAWLDQAINDLEMARLAASQGFFAQACFFSSQSAEKALKGAILELGIEPPHTHQHTELVDKLKSLGVPTQACEQLRLKPLSRMATSTRYPDEDTPPLKRFDQQDANEAINCAAAVLVQVESWDSH